MVQAPDDEALSAKLMELLVAQSAPTDASAAEADVDVNLLEQELNQIEALLDQLEAQATAPKPATSAAPVPVDGEISYL